MSWYYVANGESKGPVPEPEMRNLHAQNVIALDTPVWTEGMAEWVPFQSSPLGPVAAVTATGAPVVTHTCVECGKSFPEDEMLNYEGSWVCAADKPIFFQRVKEGVLPKGALSYATVGRRFLAFFVDGIIIDIVVLPLIILMAGFSGLTHTGLSSGANVLIYLVQYLLPAAYEIVFLGRFGATPGKMLMKIKVVRPDGSPISYARATGRYFGKILSGLILGIGYLMAFWDDEKRALHDRICETRVINVQG